MSAKLNKKDMEELREFLSRGCDYSGTQEVVNDLITETLKEIGAEYPYGDEIGLVDGDAEFSTVEDFANIFWDKAIEKILNVIETQENAGDNDGWIPVSERLPDEHKDCLVTVKYTGVMGMYGRWIKTGHVIDGEWWGDCMGGKVTAWQPLPEPYK